MTEAWTNQAELSALAANCMPGLRQSLMELAKGVEATPRLPGPHERRVKVAQGYGKLARRILMTLPPALDSLRDALGRTVVDPGLTIFDLSGVVILDGGSVIVDETLFPCEFRSAASNWRKSGFWGMSAAHFGFTDFNPEAETCVVTAKPDMAIVPGDTPYFLFNSNLATGNFGHFIHDLLPQLQAYEALSARLAVRPRPIILCPPGRQGGYDGHPFRYPLLTELFERLIAPVGDVLVAGPAPLRVTRCYGSSLVMPDPAVPREPVLAVNAFRHMKRRLDEVVLPLTKASLRAPRLYISRGDVAQGSSRRFHNLPEAEELLVGEGFQPMLVGEMPPADILQAFVNCRHLCGIHGAGLANMVFAREPGCLTELLDHPGSWPSLALIGAALGTDVRRISALPPSPETDDLPALNLPRIREAVSRA